MENENTQPKKSNNTLIILMVIAVLAIGGFFLVSNFTKKNNNTAQPAATQQTINPTSTEESTEPTGVMTEGQTFNVEAQNFSYSIKEMRVKQGEKVTVNFKNNESFHDFNLDELGVKTNVIAAGKSETVTFTPDKKGSFEYYCSVGNHRAQGMVGKLIVE